MNINKYLELMAGKRKRVAKRRHTRRVKKPIRRVSDIAVAKTQSKVKRVMYEDRTAGMVSAVNRILVTAIRFFPSGASDVLGSKDFHDAVITAAGFSTDDATLLQYYLHKMHYTLQIRNMEVEPCFMTCYIFTNKEDLFVEDLTTDIDDCASKIIADLAEGWDIPSAAAVVTLAGTGTGVVYNQGTSELALTSESYWPSNSHGFLDKWKILKREFRKLKPGDDWTISGKIPTHRYDQFRNKELTTFHNAAGGYTSSGSRMLARKGMCRIPVVFVRGTMGKEDVDETVYGWMSANCQYTIKTYAEVLPIQRTGVITVNTFANDTVSNALHGPSEHTMTVDDSGAN